MSTTKFKLKNGLPILLIENHRSPVVSVQMWVNTGSADERKGEEGISHFIEHLVFKGTRRFGVGEIASHVEGSGGELNAYTSFDQTVFYVTISKEFSETALTVIGEMMGFPKFDKTEIDNEREVVIEEIKRSNDSPGRRASRLLFETCFKKHPYGIPVIGYDKVVKGVSRNKILSYYHSRYVPANMLLVVAGNFERAQMKQKIQTHFSDFARYKLRKVTRKKEIPQKTTRVAVQEAPFEEAQLHLAWPIPGAKSKDVAALDLLAMILGQGDSSRLVQNLRLKRPIVNSVGSSSFTPRDAGLFTISATLNPEKLRETLEIILSELKAIRSVAVTSDELQRAVTNMESDQFYGIETVDGLARKAGQLETLMGDHSYFEKFMKQIYATGSSEILRVARKYLSANKLSAIVMAKDNRSLVQEELEKFAKQLKAIEKSENALKGKNKPPRYKRVQLKLVKAVKNKQLQVERISLKGGSVLLLRKDNTVPTVSVKAAFLGGLRKESATESGVTELLSRVWTSGTKNLSELDIIHRIEGMAGSLNAFSGRNTAGLSMELLKPFEKEAAELFTEILKGPVVTDEVVDREKVVLLEQIKSKQDNPGYICTQQFAETMFHGHPYARDIMGTANSAASLHAKNVSQHLTSMCQSKNMMLVVSGDANIDIWKEKLEAAVGQLPQGSKFDKTFPFAGPKKNEFIYSGLKREQSHIMIGYRGLTLDDPKRYPLQIMQSILAGQGGRLFLELRDKASLAYSVAPMHLEGIDAGYFGAYIGCSPEKGKTAIKMLREEFDKLIQVGISPAELERSKRYLIGRHDIDLQRNSSIGSALLFNEIYGIPAEEVFEYPERIAAVSALDVQKLAQQIFSQPYVLSAVGPSCPW